MSTAMRYRRQWSTDAYARVIGLYGRRCFYCELNLHRGGVQLDHVVSLALGGEDTETNLVPACCFCNNEKGGYMTASEFAGELIMFIPCDTGRPTDFRERELAQDIARAKREQEKALEAIGRGDFGALDALHSASAWLAALRAIKPTSIDGQWVRDRRWRSSAERSA